MRNFGWVQSAEKHWRFRRSDRHSINDTRKLLKEPSDISCKGINLLSIQSNVSTNTRTARNFLKLLFHSINSNLPARFLSVSYPRHNFSFVNSADFSSLTSDLLFKMPEREPRNIIEAFSNAVYNTIDGPVTWFRGLLLLLNRLECLVSASNRLWRNHQSAC